VQPEGAARRLHGWRVFGPRGPLGMLPHAKNAASMPSVHEVNDLEELAGYRLLWNSLLPQTEKATFFQSLDWLEVYWGHYGSGGRLRVLIVSAADRPIGILPLVVRTESTGLGPVRVLTYPLDNWGTSYGPIGPNPTATLLVGLKHVRQSRRDWDLLDLRWVDAMGCDLGRTRRAMESAGFRPYEQVWRRAAVVRMAGTWERYWESLSKKWRHHVDRLGRRLAEQGELTHIRYRPEPESSGGGAPRWDLYEACLQIAQDCRQGSSTTGTSLCHPRVAEYLRETHARAAKTGSLDLNLLLVDGRPAAFAYNYVYRDRVFALRTACDPHLAAFGPGTVLQRMALEESFRRGDRVYDLGTNGLDWKRHWQTTTTTSYRYTHFPTAVPRAQLLRLRRWLQDRYPPSSSCSTKRQVNRSR